MSLLENFTKNKSSPKSAPASQAPSIKEKLDTALAVLANLEMRQGEAALDALTSPDATSFTRLRDDLSAARSQVEMLRLAYAAALTRDEATMQAQRAAMQKTQINAVKKHLEMRDAAAVAFTKHITDAVASYRAMIEHNDKAKLACPIGTTWPIHGWGQDQIRRQVKNEIFRVSGVGRSGDQSRALPIPEPASASAWEVPAASPVLSEVIQNEGAQIMAKLTGGKLP